MTRIISFDIGGLGGRRKPLQIELTPSTNVLWGLNGSGKTSVLKILHSALNNDARSIMNVPFDHAAVTFQADSKGSAITRTFDRRKAEESPTNPSEDLLRRLRFTSGTSWAEIVPDAVPQAAKWDASPALDKQAGEQFEHTFLNISRISEGTRRKRTSSTTESLDEAQYDQIFATQVKEIWERYTTRSLEQIRLIQEAGIADILSAALRGQIATARQSTGLRLNEEEAYALIQDFFARSKVNLKLGSFEDFVLNYRTEPFLRTTVAIIFEVQNDIDTVQLPRRRLEELISSLFVGGKSIRFSSRGLAVHMGKKVLELESLSSGEKQMLRLLVETIAAGQNSILVDEPEISLHVDWQYKLVSSLKTVNPHAQLVLATHSPEVMATLPEGEIFQL